MPESLREAVLSAQSLPLFCAPFTPRYEAAQDLLRPLPRASVFAEWKTLIKGMIAFHTNDRKKVADLFSLIPASGAPEHAAAAFTAMLHPQELIPADAPNRAKRLGLIGQFFGAPDLGAALPEADDLWRAGKYLESLQAVKKARDFPSVEPGFVGQLSDFYYRAPFHLPYDPAQKYFSALSRMDESGRFKNAAEAFLSQRALAIDLTQDLFDDPIRIGNGS